MYKFYKTLLHLETYKNLNNEVYETPPPPGSSFLLQENASFLLQEDGGKFII